MKPLPHRYAVHLAGGATGYAALSAPELPNLASAPPRDFEGPGDAWSPEQLLVAAVEACFAFTLRAVAAASKVDVVSLEVTGEGVVDRSDGRIRFTEIVLRPRLVVPHGADPERALRVLEKSEKACLVSASLSTPVRLEPEVSTE
jgi:peroxiredoxin-like protein